MLKIVRNTLMVAMIFSFSGLSLAENKHDFSNSNEEVNRDPWEGFNRKVFDFNEGLDRYFLKPVATGYRYVTPKFVDNGVTNFFSNLQEPLVIVNDLLQGKFLQAGQDTLRFIVNSTVGIYGLLDVASRMNLPAHDEDFGQTLGYWGVPSGPYIMLPFFGPRTVRDGFMIIPDSQLNLVGEFNSEADRNVLRVTDVVDTRADLIPVEKAATGDRYIFLREVYLQKREYDVQDGEVEDTFGDE